MLTEKEAADSLIKQQGLPTSATTEALVKPNALRSSAGSQSTHALETKYEREEASLVPESSKYASKALSPEALGFSKFMTKKIRYHFHVNGDSIPQGLLPAPLNEYLEEINGLNVDYPWPILMEKALRLQGFPVTVHNHSESGRRLAGRTHFEGGRSSIGEKDGRVALQGIISQIMNRSQNSVTNEKIVIMINLGSNDLHEKGVTADYLKGSLIKHVLTILTDPLLQVKLHKMINVEERKTFLEFMKQLDKFVAEDIRKSYSEISSVVVSEPTKITSHGKSFDEITSEKNRPFIQRLFNMIGWKIILIPPVEIIGHPCKEQMMFFSAEVSKQWGSIVKETVDFFGVKNIFAVENAEKFITPHVEEFGGSIHFTQEDHFHFTDKLVQFLLKSPQLKMTPELRVEHQKSREELRSEFEQEQREINDRELREVGRCIQ